MSTQVFAKVSARGRLFADLRMAGFVHSALGVVGRSIGTTQHGAGRDGRVDDRCHGTRGMMRGFVVVGTVTLGLEELGKGRGKRRR